MDLSKVRKFDYHFELNLMDQDLSTLENRGIVASTYFTDSKSGVDIFKVSGNSSVNFHIGNFHEDDDRTFYNFKVQMSNGVVIERTFWNFGIVPMMQYEDLLSWKGLRKMSINLKVGVYEGDGSATEWQNILTHINDFTPVCGQINFHSNNMKELLSQSFYADVTFLFPSGKKLLAHKSLLSASSPYFCALFGGNFKELRNNIVKVDFEYDLMRVMVSFLYSGHLDEDDVNNWPDMYRIASYFNVDVLVNHSELQLMARTPREIEGIKKVLKFAIRYQAYRLKSFIVKLARSIQETMEVRQFRGYYIF